MAIRLSLAARTDPGMVRENNEDNFSLADLSAETTQPGVGGRHDVGGNGLVAMVADGMGGAAAGEIASRMALDGVSSWLLDNCDADGASPEDLIAEALRASNQGVHRRARDDDALHGMGTTLTCAWIRDAAAHIGQVGDSRAYLLRGGRIQQLTQDQSLREHLIAEQGMTPEEAKRRAQKNVILQAIGVRSEVDPATLSLPLYVEDIILLCSDGLVAAVSDEQIQAIIGSAENLEAAADDLVAAANANGGPDNITVVLVGIDSLGNQALASDDNHVADPDFDPDQTLQLPRVDGRKEPPDVAQGSGAEERGGDESAGYERTEEKPGGTSSR